MIKYSKQKTKHTLKQRECDAGCMIIRCTCVANSYLVKIKSVRFFVVSVLNYYIRLGDLQCNKTSKM